MRDFTWKCCDQRTGAQLATVVGGGRWASRGPNPLLQAQLGGLRMVPVPWLTSSKPAQMSRSPPPPPTPHTHRLTHTQTPPLLELSLDPSTKTKHSGDISYHKSSHRLFELVSLLSHLPCTTSFFLSLSPSVLPRGPERARSWCRPSFDTEHGQISE